MIDPESKRKGIENLVKWGVILVALAATASMAMWLVEGLVAWSILGLTFLVVTNFAPAVATWFANKKIQALVAVIEANPIETMTNLFMEKSTDLNQAEQAITKFETEFRNVSDMVDDLEKSDPEEAASYAEMRDKMEEGLTSLREEQQYARAELAAFKSKIDKAKRIYKVALAMNAALAMDPSAQKEVFADIKEQVSFDAVRTSVNLAFSNLNTKIERRKTAGAFKATKLAPKQLEAAQEPNLPNLTTIKNRQTIDISPKGLR